MTINLSAIQLASNSNNVMPTKLACDITPEKADNLLQKLGNNFLNELKITQHDVQPDIIIGATGSKIDFSPRKLLKIQQDLDQLSNEIALAAKVTGLFGKAINQLVAIQ